MVITRTSSFSGKVASMDLNITEAQIAAWQGGTHIQFAMPQIGPGEREFLMTGVTPEEWDAMFPEEEEDEG
jgi:hypothetical protein